MLICCATDAYGVRGISIILTHGWRDDKGRCEDDTFAAYHKMARQTRQLIWNEIMTDDSDVI